EQPDRKPGDGKQLLQDLQGDADPLIQAVARATSDREWVEWQARDTWPPRTLHRSNVVLAGDAAHAMLPTLGQGACQSIEDAAVLAKAVAAADTIDEALRRYESARVPRLRRIITLTRAGAMGRRSNAASRALPAATVARLTALSGGPMLRRITRPTIAVPG
ncbi:MAG TPA: FAD-dependent monooxygenase, partial [Trebonia sp.]|nr:FAD-dependent monooxygenase [Trebonia sp.]